jgi:hypothetical protein
MVRQQYQAANRFIFPVSNNLEVHTLGFKSALGSFSSPAGGRGGMGFHNLILVRVVSEPSMEDFKHNRCALLILKYKAHKATFLLDTGSVC